MGTYTHLTVAGYPVIDSKSAVIPEVMTIFRESDRRSFRRRVADQNELIWGKPDPDNTDEEDATDYCCEISKVLDRLDVMGFTHARIKAEFDEAKQFEIDKYVEWGGKVIVTMERR